MVRVMGLVVLFYFVIRLIIMRSLMYIMVHANMNVGESDINI